VPEAADICRLAVRDVAGLKPDFVVHCGDVTNDGSRDSMRLAREVFRELDCPFYFAPGNHDCWEKGGRTDASALFGLAGGTLYQAVHLDEALLLVLDGAYWESREVECRDYLDRRELERTTGKGNTASAGARLCIPTPELAWVEAVLRDNGDKPVLVFIHAPLRSRGVYDTSKSQSGRPLSEVPMRLPSVYCNSERLLNLLLEAGNVRAVFAGHRHWNECHTEDGLLHCLTGALIQYPCEMRLVELADGRLSGRMIPLSDPSYAERSYVPDGDGDFIPGRAEDREFEIS
jgi:predicted phosphodiesterase